MSFPEDSKVALLLNTNNEWDTSIIRQHFTSLEAETILRIPLPRVEKEDHLIWHYEKRGEYTVKSGYQVALGLNFPDSLSSSSNFTGWLKLNVDAAVYKSNNKAGIGAVIKNSDGKLTAAAVKTTSYKGDVEIAEAEAIIFGVEVALEARLSPIIIESNSLNIVNMVNKKLHSSSEVCWLISDIQDTLVKNEKFVVSHIPGSCNVVAHNLAKCAFDFDKTMVWLEKIPNSILCICS
ncbi:Ribonuclease H-like domain containing protein [Melia azedarach]|uniref:Ribonuclease H-like domain containing protein n=1 Tax=Melia azedarach TaxID=155640 RepID=A0ACC1WUS9_MELAZ|nr:Ribonuclease H-like domain containing protein [Melia azedarach]